MQKAQELQVRSLGGEEPLQEDTATHCSILAWRTPWAEEPGGYNGPSARRESDATGLLSMSTCPGSTEASGSALPGPLHHVPHLTELLTMTTRSPACLPYPASYLRENRIFFISTRRAEHRLARNLCNLKRFRSWLSGQPEN